MKIVEMADRRFAKQRPIPVKKIKEELQKIYDTVGLGEDLRGLISKGTKQRIKNHSESQPRKC